MAELKVFFVHLRRPRSASVDPDERRDDPFYEFGSFGCTGCHSTNLFHPRHAKELEGARLAFVQGGPRGFRLVFLTPPITVKRWKDRCEAKWTPTKKPFQYSKAPILAYNDARGDFPLVEEFAKKAARTKIEGGLSSLFRSRAKPLPSELANEVIAVYEQRRAKAPRSDLALTYEEALPWDPPMIDCNRKDTYEGRIRELDGDTNAEERVLYIDAPPRKTQSRSRCDVSRRARSARRVRRCT